MANESKLYPVILSGGSGSRLWPLSRAHYPKQLLPLSGDNSMLQDTALRVSDKTRYHAPLIIANNEHRFIVAEQLQQAGVSPRAIVLEPLGRNTAPAVTVAALMLQREDPNAIMVLLPSDHVVADQQAFAAAVDKAAGAAAGGHLVTFGITPRHPETGYGYIRQGEVLTSHAGAFGLSAFVEKPDLPTAEGYLASGDYLWNSGMFVLPAQTYLDEVERLAPKILEQCDLALEQSFRDLDFVRLDEPAFAACPSDSIDYAVMEHTHKAAVVPADIGWNDVGAWPALWDIAEKDAQGNVCAGDHLLRDVSDSYIRAEDDRMIAAIGLENLIIVSTDDALMIAPKARAGEVKDLVDSLKSADRSEAIHHRRVYRPWGNYKDIDEDQRFRVKRIIVKPGGILSLQKHKHRSEHWVVVKGVATVTCGEEETTLNENQSVYIPKGVIHRLANKQAEALHLIEVQVGDYVGEDDIIRIEDTYGRD
ncbi:mannose-1-phosphate guanylyltransferase/mannose-6-phosphate isomerase [Pelagibius sp. Alg239-R121]|uniref:mannose-1-phosphate guanylyltransferase/mannose-6-phosphate isomerase n=1 Tax=Pelagibius sp. Alg239-R121 TaxID=2993448 RepID=UPI0024A774DD|nr:mannose-1-phosphate guanylyltransferase/mannose-6-phosphate isomerase [Pelagibius sp. Alg239-R121]